MPTISERLMSNARKRSRKKSESDNHNGPEPVKTTMNKGKKTLDDIMTQLPYRVKARVQHHHIPNFNACQLPVDDLKELQDFPSITISMPHPVYVAPRHRDPIDVCHRRPMARERHFKRLNLARTSYLTVMKKRKFREDQKKGIYPAWLYDFAERLNSNPDPFFNSSYDYYYAGGNLCVLPDSNHVVHTAGDNLKDIVISRLSNKEDISNVPMHQLCNKSLGQSSEILQVIPFLTGQDDRPNCFATRERNSITVHCLNEENELKGVTQYNNASTPFISFAQSAGDLNKFIITNMKQHVRLFDINSSKSTLSKLYEVGSMSWNTVKPWREHTYLYANSKNLMLMDMRTDPSEWRRNKCVFATDDLFCQQISSLALSSFKNQFYVGTSHKLFCLDTRCWGQTFEGPATVCRWIHMLEYPPLFVEAFRGGSSEYVALSGPLADDFRICELQRDGRVVDYPDKKAKLDELKCRQKYIYKSLSLPYQPTTLTEAYRAARLHGKCLRPDADLQRRLKSCTTGLAFYENAENKYDPTLLLKSNSIGDVFAYKLGVRQSQDHEPRTSAITDSVMRKYEERICAIESPPLNYTHVQTMKGMSKVFRCSKLDYKTSADPFAVDGDNESDDANKDFKLLKTNRQGRWQKSMFALNSCKDVLSKDLLSIWDIDIDEERYLPMKELKREQRIKPDAHDLVADWLNTKMEEQPMISIPTEVVNDSMILDDSESEQRNQSDLTLREFSQSAKEVPQSTQQTNECNTFQKQFTEFVTFNGKKNDSKLNNSNISLNEPEVSDTAAFTRTQQANVDKRQTTQKKRRKVYIKGF